jgi:hypothetical protein
MQDQRLIGTGLACKPPPILKLLGGKNFAVGVADCNRPCQDAYSAAAANTRATAWKLNSMFGEGTN